MEHQEKRFLPNPIEEWDRDQYFMIKLLDVILDKLGWIGGKSPSDGLEINIHQGKNIKALREIKESFYEEKSHGR